MYLVAKALSIYKHNQIHDDECPLCTKNKVEKCNKNFLNELRKNYRIKPEFCDYEIDFLIYKMKTNQ